MSFIDTADRVRDSILGSIDWASRFGNQLNENFVGQQEIPERLSRTRLNDANNRFNLSSRLATWEDDLAANSAESQYNNWFNNYRLSEFDDITRQESLKRDFDIMNTRANIDNFESQQKLAQLQTEQAQLESEEAIDKLTFDRMYTDLVNNIPDYASMSPSQKYEVSLQRAEETNAPERVKARIRRNYLEVSKEQLDAIRQMSVLVQQRTQLERLMSQTGEAPNASMINTWNDITNRISGFQVQITDPAIIRNAVDLGIITIPQAGSLLNQSRMDLGFSPVNTPSDSRPQWNPFFGPNGYQPNVSPPSQPAQQQTPLVQAQPVMQDNGVIIQPGQSVPMPTQPVQQQEQITTPQIQGGVIVPPQPTEDQFSVPYQESNLVSSVINNGRIVQAIESDVNFPRDLVGVLAKTDYNRNTWIQDRDNLIRLYQQLETINDPMTRTVMLDIIEAKLDAFARMIQQNGISLN